MPSTAPPVSEFRGSGRKSASIVVDGVTEMVANGTLRSGSVLPPERSLASHFKVDRKAVRRAIMLLMENGVVKSHGPRTRTIDPAAAASITSSHNSESIGSAKFIQKCMVILTPEVNEVRRGFLLAISNGVTAGIRGAGFDAIHVHPNKVANGVIDSSLMEILNAKPAGVLLPDFRGSDTFVRREFFAKCRELEVPLVTYGGYPENAGQDRVITDHDHGAYVLTKWLIAQGRRRILQIAPSKENYWFGNRRTGFERAITEADLELLPVEALPNWSLDNVGWTEAFFADVTRHSAGYLVPYLLNSNPVDAIVGITDGSAHQLIAACQWLGRKPHDDVMVVGYDNYWADCQELSLIPHPVAATVDKQNFEVGMEMVNLLMQRMNGELSDEPQTRVIEPKLIVVPY